ncbi:PVC-type heme-binding CxxCH protein [Planctomycetaceae bacterium SH139]
MSIRIDRSLVMATRACLIVCWLLGGMIISSPPAQAQPKTPRVPDEVAPRIEILQPGVELELLAEHPALATPTGIDVDAQGQIWVVACHTHFRPEDYAGPQADEVLIFDADGSNRRVFYNKTIATMQLRLGPDGWVYLAQRDRILRVKDSDGDGVGDLEEEIASLDTVTDYPHNGLSGMAWHPDGGLVFALGENFGANWTLTARDGTRASGRGEGGVFRCQTDGTQLRRIAKGFWNPFGLMVRGDGEMFAAENDPGSRPPCRLLQIIEGADYGFQWVYGSSPVHPFVAWNGELRGTLGMIHPCGEGPSGIVQLGGGVLIPSWSNHCLDYFPLHREGAGYRSERIELLRGGEFFRPVCIAVGPAGSYYLTDWVFSSYEVHGRGRIWKLTIDSASGSWLKPQPEPPNADALLANQLRSSGAAHSLSELFALSRGSDPILADAALSAIALRSESWTPESLRKLSDSDRLMALVALRRVDLSDSRWVRALWSDSHPDIRFEVLRWIADGVLTEFKDDVQELLRQPNLDYSNFEAALATWNTLAGNPQAGVTNVEVLLQRLTDSATPAKLKGFALRLVPAEHPQLDTPFLRELATVGDAGLLQEVIRALASHPTEDKLQLSAGYAADQSLTAAIRCDAIAGLGHSRRPEHQQLLLTLAGDADAAIRHEALRALRTLPLDAAAKETLAAIAARHPAARSAVRMVIDGTLDSDRPPVEDTSAWLERLDQLSGEADALAGRRIFFNSKIGQCAQCHRYAGRGNVVGPDLSLIDRQGDRASMLRAILQPNRDVAPQYFVTALELADGNVFSGILLRSSSVDVFRDSQGKERVFQKSDVVGRTELKSSLMPTGLISQLTDRDLRDLLAFLMRVDFD